MQRKLLALYVTTASVLFLSSPRLFASCGQAFCPIETSSVTEQPLWSGQLSVNLVYEFIDQDRPFIGTSRARVGEMPRAHDEVSTRNQTYKLALDYGLTPRLTLGILVPFLDRLHRHIDNEEQEVVGGSLEDTEIVRVPERWRYLEFGDIQLTTRYQLLHSLTPLRPSLSLIVGAKVPTGRTGVKHDAGETAELTLQPGNGSWDGLIGLSYVQSVSVSTLRHETALAPFFVTTLARFPVGVGKFGYEPGPEVFFNVGFAYPLLRKLDLLGQLNFHYRDRDDIGHAPGVEQEDTGREELFLSPGVRYHLTPHCTLYALVQFAVYRRVNGIQLTSDWNFTSGISYRFNLFS